AEVKPMLGAIYARIYEMIWLALHWHDLNLESPVRYLLLMVIVLLASFAAAHADEGFWQPAQLPGMSKSLHAAGLKLESKALAKRSAAPLAAVISLGDCSGAFVSKTGLIVTSQTCARRALGFRPSGHDTAWVDGFYASTPANELRGVSTARVYVTVKVSDVSKQIEVALHPWLTGDERYRAIERAKNHLVEICQSPSYRCRVLALNAGTSYRLVKQLALRDIRLVYAPARSISGFGGAAGKQGWPRYQGNFSFLRAYVAPDGEPAAYAQDNVPYQPMHALKFNAHGVQAGAFVMLAGYPERSQRNDLAAALAGHLNVIYPARVKHCQQRLQIIQAAAQKDAQVNTLYAAMMARLDQCVTHLNARMVNMQRTKLVAVKQAQDDQLVAWLKQQDGTTNKARLAAIDKLQQAVVEDLKTHDRDAVMALLRAPVMLHTALTLVQRIHARAKLTEAQRDVGYQQRDGVKIRAGLKRVHAHVDLRVDQQLLVYALEQYQALPAAQHLPALDDWLGHADTPNKIATKVRALYADSDLGEAKARRAWLTASPETLADSNDSLMVLARVLQPALEQVEQEAHAQIGLRNKLRQSHIAAVQAWKQAQALPTYADANGSLRVSFGKVQGISPRDAVSYAAFSTLQGIAEQATGAMPFDASQAELDAIEAKAWTHDSAHTQETMPVEFVATLDAAEGNQG
ncbi:MAG: S46 family peptidase, partial [Xanthomonadales bacterium]|nr:S46 family peptidase [Xanthomonadales bacterium]